MSSSKPPQDDRNLVEVTPEIPQPSEEERLAMWWNASKGYVIIAAVVFIVAVIGNQAVSAMREGAIADQQRAYLDALDAGTLAEFAQDEADSHLGAFALLQQADAAYAEGDYAAAISAYEQAAEPLADTPLHGRAQLGLAFAQARSGNTAGAKTIFNTLKGVEFPEIIQGEAAYALAILALDAGDETAFAAEAAFLRDLQSSQAWISRLEAVAPGRV